MDDFAVGMPSALPSEGSAVDGNSYRRCGTIRNIAVSPGLVITIDCTSYAQRFRYVIVQSLDGFAERLCIAEVAVYEEGLYAVTSAIKLHATENCYS